MGRPSTFTQEVADDICRRLSQGESLRSICSAENNPHEATVRGWVIDKPDFATQYARARDVGLDCAAERVREIVRDVKPDDVPRARLEFDAERWYLSKLAPKRYGDRIQAELAGEGGGPITLNIIPVKPNEESK